MKKVNKILLTSLMAVPMFSVSTVSAAQTVTEQLPDTVTRKVDYSFVKAADETGSTIYRALSTDGKYVLYCSDRTNENVANDVLTKNEKVPYGYAYILKNSYPTKKLISNVNASEFGGTHTDCATVGDEMLNIYITQSALWGYKGTISNENRIDKDLKFTNYDPTSGAAVDHYCAQYEYNGTTYNTYGGAASTTYVLSNLLWDTYINNLITGAKNVQDPANTSLTLSAVSNWTEEGDVYKSDLILASLSNEEASAATYKLKLSDAPNGTKMYTESGSEISESGVDVSFGTRFYITVPKKEVASGKANFSVNATSDVTYDQAYQYVDKTSNHQPSVLVGPEQKQILGSLSLTIVPDTASMISKSIYFIGFIILLSGAGIIYANVRPKKVKE